MPRTSLRLPTGARRASGRAGSAVPEPESTARRRWIQLVTVAAVVISCLYLTWRALETTDLHVWWISVPLLLLEAHALLSLLLFAVPLWDLDAVPPPAPVDAHPLALAILIPTYNEPVEVLLPTVAAAVSVDLPHETWVLDDGDRPHVAELAAQLGARYLTREVHDHAKAGNVNHALQHVDADIIAILDADHVAHRDLFRNTLGYFDDPLVALVQTPQDFYNEDSFEHTAHRGLLGRLVGRLKGQTPEAQRYSEQELFYRALQPGRNRWNAPFWCGTGAIVHMDALREVGGLAVETVTEDIHTTIRLHRLGWKTRFHNEVLARGLAAADAAQYLEQRVRWGTGGMQVLRAENPAFVSGLTVMQRISYLGTLLGWFDAWRSLGYLLAPMVVLATGAVPVRAELGTFLLWFGTAFAVQRLALRLLSRGMAPQGIATVFELVRMPANLRATLRLLSRRERAFTVTAKGRTGDERARVPVPPLLRTLLVLSVVAGVWGVLTAAGLTPLTYGVPWAAYGSMFWLAVNGVLLAVAVRRISLEQFGAERRASFRFDVHGMAELDGQPVALVDASLTGIQVALPFTADQRPDQGQSVHLVLSVEDQEVGLEAVVRSARTQSVTSWLDVVVLGLEFADGQLDARARLALGLFGTETELPVPAEGTLAAAPLPAPVDALEAAPSAVPAQVSAADRDMAAALDLPVAALPGLSPDAERLTAQLLRELAPLVARTVQERLSGVDGALPDAV